MSHLTNTDGKPDPLRQSTLAKVLENLSRPEGTPFSAQVRLCSEHPALAAQVIESLERQRRHLTHELKQAEVDLWQIRGDPADGSPYPIDNRGEVIRDDRVAYPVPVEVKGDGTVPP